MTRRKMLAAVAVVIWCILIALLIRWRSAPPPPPDIRIPGGAASPAASSPSVEPPSSAAANAADFYRKAIDLYAGLTEQETDMLANSGDDSDAKAAAALDAKIAPIMDLLRGARRADHVDWGMGRVTFGDKFGEHIQRLHDLAQLALWEARHRLQTDPGGGVRDVAALEALIRSAARSLDGLAIENNMHTAAVRLIAQHASAVPVAAQADLEFIASQEALAQCFKQGIEGDAAMMQALLDDYTNPLTRDAAVPSIQQWMNVEDRDGAAITPEEAEAELAWMERTERTLADSIMAPDGKYRQWWALKYSEAAAMPAAANRLRRLQELRGQTRVLMMENVLLAAGMALARHDQARFLAIVDPDCGRPFTCAPAGNGFQLCSTLMLGGAPVGLSFSTTGNTKP